MATDDLKRRCLFIADSAQAALAWVSDPENAETVGSDKKIVMKELRRDEMRARQLARAVERPMSIGVYGPSQAGKSYLVSVLAQPRDGRLVAAVGDGMDFITEINPEGDKEATGLVTRFTMRPQICPAGYPVTLKLLSEADVIRILANTFFRDGDNTEAPPTPAEIAVRLSAARSKSGTGRGLTEADVWDIQSYFENNFRGTAYAKELGPLWEEAAEILPKLDVAARTPLLALLWGDYPMFSELYGKLAEALDKLGHPELAYAGIESLTPRSTSIIDVATLFGLDGMGDTGPVMMRSEAGTEYAVPRPVVAALTAELVLPMVTKPWDLFDGADLLDFPGVRERKVAKGGIEAFSAASEAPRKDLFLRGKVGFLFERYVAQQDLTAMMLCIPPSNVNVAADLSAGVDEWIARTQGATAEERSQVDTMLFLILTMFDRHLADPAGSLDPHQRFENRIEASLIAPFGGLRDSWPLNWTPTKPFDNLFWLRNPNYPAEHVIKYENGVEIEVLEHKKKRIAELKTGCLSSDLVQRHMADPDASWEAAMALRDGGVERIANHLTPVATTEVKERQIEARLRELGEKLIRRLKPLYSDSDVEKRLKARRGVAAKVIKELRKSFENRRFARVVEELGVSADALVWRMDRVPANVQIVMGNPTPVEDDIGDWMDDHFGDDFLEQEAEEPVQSNEPEVRMMTQEEFQAETAIKAWKERMQSLAERTDIHTRLNLSPNAASEIAIELAGAARRLGLAERISKELKTMNALQTGTKTAAWLSAVRINEMVTTAGVSLVEEQARPILKNTKTGAERPVFRPKPSRDDAMDLPTSAAPSDRIYFQDWTFALLKLFEGNAQSEDGMQLNIEQNARLGDTLAGLEAST